MTLTDPLPLETVRLFYAEDVRSRANIPVGPLARAFATVAREHYLGGGPWDIVRLGDYVTTEDANPRHLYHDELVAIDRTRWLNNGQPSALAAWMHLLGLEPGNRVFHGGCGVGYYTSILAEVVGPNGDVLAVEIDSDLAMRARDNLSHLGNVQVVCADAITYDPGERDAMFINAGVTHPQPLWLDRLRPNGRLVLPMTVTRPSPMDSKGAWGSGHMLLVRRVDDGYRASFESMVAIYSSPTGRDPRFNAALGRLFQETIVGKRADIRMVRRDAHEPEASCWLHGEGFCLSSGDGANSDQPSAIS
jgi:protein-L-isoaspartate(D-aspartate) O-methyltransferase